MSLFYFIFLFCERNGLHGLLYVLFPTKFTGNILQMPKYWTCLHIELYGWLPWYFPSLIRTHRMFYSALWCHGLIQSISCIYLTCGIYRPYSFVHNLGICTPFLNILSWLLLWRYCVQLPFLENYLSVMRSLEFYCRTYHACIFICVDLP